METQNEDSLTRGKESDPKSLPSGEAEKKEEFVKYDTYKKAVNQEKNLRQKLDEISSKLSEYENREKEQEERKLTEQGELKKLLALKEKEISRFKDENLNLNQKWDDAIKLTALRDKLPGPVRDDDCYSIIRKRLKDIVIDPETGDIVEESLNSVAEDLVKNKIYLFDVKNGSGLPSQAPKGSPSQLTVAQWKDLPLKEKKARMHEIMPLLK